jgi:hypothetical protein
MASTLDQQSELTRGIFLGAETQNLQDDSEKNYDSFLVSALHCCDFPCSGPLDVRVREDAQSSLPNVDSIFSSNGRSHFQKTSHVGIICISFVVIIHSFGFHFHLDFSECLTFATHSS